MLDRRRLMVSLGVLAAASAQGVAPAWSKGGPIPPKPPREPRIVGKFGHQRTDDYAWLRPKDWHAVLRDPASLDAPIKAAVLAENAYADAMLAPAAALRAKLAARAEAVEPPNAGALEVEDGGYLYYRREAPGQDHPVYARRPISGGSGGGPEQVLLDVGAEAKGKTFYSLVWSGPRRGPDGKLFGWAADQTGSGIFAVRVREVATGKMLVDDIENTHGEIAFAPDGRHLYYTGRGDKGWPDSVWRRDMQTGVSVKIYDQDDPGLFVSLKTTASGGFVVIRLFNGATTECLLIPGDDPTAKPIVVEPRTEGLDYDVDHWNGALLILTDADGATDFKVMTAPVDKPGRAHWRPLTPHVPGRFIAALHPFKDRLVREEWRDAKPRLVVASPDGTEHDAGFDEPAYALSVPGGQGYDAASLAFLYQSPKTPPRAHRLALATGQAQPVGPLAKAPAYDPSRYVVERIEAKTADGALVPITILRAKNAPRDGKAPLFLYGYGSYGATVEAEFSPSAIALVDQGWTYAIAHVRGGAERGSAWWRTVLKHGKKLTFTDFITCAEHLVAQRYTARGKIVAHGYSAGGLLMGAIYTMRPDLWAGVIAQVPFVDVLNTMDDFDTHPLGKTAIPVWGDPRVPEDYAYVASYSPYDQLKPAAYPALLATGSVADDRVAFWEPVKFAVKARALTTADKPIMVKIAMAAGHMGASGAGAARDQLAMFGEFAILAVTDRWPRP